MINRMKETLKKYFGYSEFRKGQEEIIQSILEGRDTVGIMPTGGGKSICYQVPALLFSGVTLVISPLISLMKDQVDALTELEIPSTYINSSLSYLEIEKRIALAAKGGYRIIYIAPERLETESFMQLLKNMEVSLIAVDEAHCVSQWGHDFRPSYRNISRLIQQFDKRPVVAAFTATATVEVGKDVRELLMLDSPKTYVMGFDRSNLHFSVVKGANKDKYINDFLKSHIGQSGIIYAATRKEADRLYDMLNAKGYCAGRYHAGLSDKDRSHNQDNFLFDNIQVMVATNAFGMGIDKSNVRYVIHYNMPKNIEAYYQEAGRGGRDGMRAECVLLYRASDVHIQKFLIEQSQLSPDKKSNEYKKLQEMVDYCHIAQCIRKYILEYFGEPNAPDTCENCSNCDDTTEFADITVDAQKIFSCIKRMGEKYGVSSVAAVLKGANTKKIRELGFEKLSTYGLMQAYTLQEITDLINLLVAEDYLVTTGDQYPVVKLNKKAAPVLTGTDKVIKRVSIRKVKDEADMSLFTLLRALRKEISEAERIPPYVIFHDSTLQEMCKRLPVDEASMLGVPGVGESKVNKYGKRFLEAIHKYMMENGITPLVNTDTVEAKPRKDKTPAHMITYNMYKQGKRLKEIAEEREVTVRTIEEHMIKCSSEGLEVDWDRFVPAGWEELVLNAASEVGAHRLAPIKEKLPEEITYFAIKAVLCKHRDRLSAG